jgi:hypothetical protein
VRLAWTKQWKRSGRLSKICGSTRGKRAEIALTQADALAHAAVADIGDTSRELRDKTEEIAAPAEGKTPLKDEPDLNGPRLPPASPLIVAGYNDE